jgi:hypothetical protein
MGTDPEGDFAPHALPYINRYKVVELMMVNGISEERVVPSDIRWGNW